MAMLTNFSPGPGVRGRHHTDEQEFDAVDVMYVTNLHWSGDRIV